jgi:hypothetical protein
VTEFAARDHALRMAAGMSTPGDKGVVLFACGSALAGDVTIGKALDEFRIGRRALEAALFVAITEDVGLESGFHDFALPGLVISKDI